MNWWWIEERRKGINGPTIYCSLFSVDIYVNGQNFQIAYRLLLTITVRITSVCTPARKMLSQMAGHAKCLSARYLR